jgi:lon-related putative ATP-dependent protease
MTNSNDGSGLAAQLRIPVDRLTTRIDENELGFTSTREVAPLDGTIGQERALRALDFGLDVDAQGFNIFVAGGPGTGRNTTLAGVLGKLAASRPVPNDWVYVYNFADPMRPRGISLPPGMGRQLATDMGELASEAKARIPRAFEGPVYQQRVEAALSGVHEQHRGLTEQMTTEAQSRGVALSLTESGIIATPLGADGEPLTPEQLGELSPEDSERIQQQQHSLQEFIAERVPVLRQLERDAARVRQVVNREIAEFVLQALFAEMRETHKGHAETLEYLDEVRENMIVNVAQFLHQERPEAPHSSQELLAGGGDQDDMVRYQVNVFVDHSRSHGAPVVFEQSPTYNNVFGRARHTMRQGVMSTDFTMVSSGCIHTANGGFLVFQVTDLLTYPFVWQALKQALKNRQARVENLSEQFSAVPTFNLEPEAVPLDLKIVLVGNPHVARSLMLYDEDFPKLFKVKAEFGHELELNVENIKKHAQFVVNRVQEHDLPHFAASGVARLIEHSSRLVEDQGRLTAKFADIADLITEAAYCAKTAAHDLVTGEDILQAVHERRLRSNMIEDRLQGLYDEGTIRLEVDGEEVGQINGLAVIDMGDYSFGRPSRLTARISLGRGEFANVEQASQMSGRIHSKGFQILTSYLLGKYGVDATLPIRASVAFEQTYEEIDGDSASSTEIYALLSALSGVPIQQGFAVTGSVDQQGRVQAIGGATRKIEGFFDVCKAKGLTGKQGVMIPASNVRHLVLRQEVVDAVAAGEFSVYAVETIEQGIELLTGMTAGEEREDGTYAEGTINAKVMATLTKMAASLRGNEGSPRAPRDGEKPVAIEGPEDHDPREGPGEPPEPAPEAKP